MLEAPAEGARGEERRERCDGDRAVRRRERLPTSQQQRRGDAAGEAQRDTQKRRLREPNVTPVRGRAPALAEPPPAAQREPRAQRSGGERERPEHPERVQVGEVERDGVVAGGI